MTTIDFFDTCYFRDHSTKVEVLFMLARHLLIVLDDSVHYFYIRTVYIFSLFKICLVNKISKKVFMDAKIF